MALVFAALLALCGFGLAAASLRALAALNLRGSTLDGTPGVLGPSDDGAPRPLLLVVVDGLRADVAAELPAIGALAARGTWVELAAEEPTFSSPQYVALLCGVPPVESGVRSNHRLRRVTVDCLPDRVRAAGGRASAVGDEVDWWAQLFAWDEALLVRPDELLPTAARRAGDTFLLVHVTGVDQAGHRAGAASAAYREAAARADAQVAELLRRFADRTVVVMSDHGHRDAGGHGGTEPEVRRAWLAAVGPLVWVGGRASGSMSDVAPTLAALIGVPSPAHALGRTLDVLRHRSDHVQRVMADVERMRALLVAGHAGRAALFASEWSAQRLRAAALFVVLVLAAWVVRREGRMAVRGLFAGLLGLALAAAAFAATVGVPSFSAARTTDALAARAALAGLACLVPFLPAFVSAARRQLSPSDACAWSVTVR